MPRRLLWPALMTAIMLAVLVALGTWQLHRLAWKTALLARIDAAEQAPGIPLQGQPPAFTKVSVTGTPHPGAAGHYGVEVRDLPGGSVIGSQLVDVLDRAAAPPLLVLEGWVPQGRTPPPPSPDMPRTVEGYLREPEHGGMFSAHDDVAARLFYTLDPAAIGAGLGVAGVAPFVLVRLGTPQPGVFPQPATSLPRPPNDHLSYAITWYGFAVILLVIFALYARKTLRA